MNFAEWNHGLLLSVVLVITGGMLLVGAASLRERLIAIGTVSQAVVLAFVTNGAFHGRNDLSLAAIVLASLVVLWSLLVSLGPNGIETTSEVGPAIDLPSRDVVADAVSVGSDAGSIRHDVTVMAAVRNDDSHSVEER